MENLIEILNSSVLDLVLDLVVITILFYHIDNKDRHIK